MDGSSSEGDNGTDLHRDVAYCVGFEVFVYDLCVIPFLGTNDRVDCYTLFDVRGTAEGVRVDDILHEGVEYSDIGDGNREVPHRTLGVGGLDKVSHVTTHTPGPAVSRVTTGILNYYFEWY